MDRDIMEFLMWHITVEIFVTIGAFGGADQINNHKILPEDRYLTRIKRKFNVFYFYFTSNVPVRRRAYWMFKGAYINIIIYFAILIIGFLCTQSFEFVARTIFLLYPLVMGFYNLFWDLGMYIYVQYKDHQIAKKI